VVTADTIATFPVAVPQGTSRVLDVHMIVLLYSVRGAHTLVTIRGRRANGNDREFEGVAGASGSMRSTWYSVQLRHAT
jgi:hypothetical protein